MPNDAPAPFTSGNQERHLAVSTVIQQGSFLWTTAVMLVVVTALARTLSLSQFGVYGLTVSFATYLLVAQGAIESAAIRLLAQAPTQDTRDRVFSMAIYAYLLVGVAIAILIAGGGNLLVGALDIPEPLHHQARMGFALLGMITLFGLPLKTFQDVLRGTQHFMLATSAEVVAFLAFGVAMAIALIVRAPLWVIIGIGGAVPALTGLCAAVILQRSELRVAYRHGSWRGDQMRAFLRASGALFLTSLADLFVYSLDRIILGLFRPASTVALYEGPVRAHNVVRQVQGVLALTILPAGSSYMAADDGARVKDLIVRGTRYTLFISLPLVIVFMTLAQPLLTVWLGTRYAPAATAMTILVSYWLVSANTNVAGTMLVAAGKMRALATYAWVVAIANLVLSLTLTPWLGLNGVVLGTAIPAVLAFPWFMWLVQRWLPITLDELARRSWLQPYAVAAIAAVALIGLRLALQPTTLGPVLALAAGGVLGSWLATYTFCLTSAERHLVADMGSVIARRLRGFTHRRAT